MTRRATFLFAAALAMQTSQGFANTSDDKTANEPVATGESLPDTGNLKDEAIPEAPKPKADKKKPVFDPDYSPCSALPVLDRTFG